MSVKVMGKIWDMTLEPGQKLVLLALADHADHDGKDAYPGNDLLAHKTGLSKRQVQRILSDMEAIGVIRKEKSGVGRGQKAGYEFDLKKMTPRPLIEDEKDDTMSTFTNDEKATSRPLKVRQKGDKVSTDKKHKKVTFATQKGDICDNPPTPPYKENRPETLGATARERASTSESDAEWLARLEKDPAYEGLEIQKCFRRMCNWCEANHKKPTRRRFINWLNREDRPIGKPKQETAMPGMQV